MIDEGMKNLNPQITEFTIGVRNLREIKIYPLSIYDQQQMGDLIAKGLEKFFSIGDSSDNSETVKIIIDLIKDNLVKMLDLITEDEENGNDLLKDITNTQAGDLALLLFDVNYDTLIKKVKNLLEKAGIMEFQSGRSLLQSVKDTDTVSPESSTEDLEKED